LFSLAVPTGLGFATCNCQGPQ